MEKQTGLRTRRMFTPDVRVYVVEMVLDDDCRVLIVTGGIDVGGARSATGFYWKI
jgi:hypothetical protein